MMCFILVKCVQDRFPGFTQWRATCTSGASPIDVFFFADDITAAKAIITDRYPSATFSDERVLH